MDEVTGLGEGPTGSTGTVAVDVSNTLTTVALWSGDAPVHHWRFATDTMRTADEYQVLLSRLFARDGVAAGDVSACVVGCVVPALTTRMADVCRRLFGREPLIVGPGVHTGLRIDTADPREVGADRIANGVAAMHRFGTPVLVLDFGTALTVDAISADGAYVGAIIAPGLEVAAEGLARRAARLGRIDLVAPPCVVADNTEQALQAGLVYGYVGLMEGLIERARAEIGPARAIATGDAPVVAELLRLTTAIDAYVPLLTLEGLRLIQRRHEASKR